MAVRTRCNDPHRRPGSPSVGSLPLSSPSSSPSSSRSRPIRPFSEVRHESQQTRSHRACDGRFACGGPRCGVGAIRDRRRGQGHVRRGAPWRHRRSLQRRAHRTGEIRDDGWRRTVSHCRSAPRDVRGDVHAHGISNSAARRHAVAGGIHCHRRCRDEGRRETRDDYRHGRGADRRRSKRSRDHEARSRGARQDPDRAEHLGDGPAHSGHQPVQQPQPRMPARSADRRARPRPTCRCTA